MQQFDAVERQRNDKSLLCLANKVFATGRVRISTYVLLGIIVRNAACVFHSNVIGMPTCRCSATTGPLHHAS